MDLIGIISHFLNIWMIVLTIGGRAKTVTYALKILYGSKRNLVCDTSPSWTFQMDNSNIETPVVASNSIQLEGKVLTIINTSSSHEGVYQCHANKKFNVTVLGVARFVGCEVPLDESKRNCDLGTMYTFSEHEPIFINISLDFYGGGNRNMKQSITSINVINPNDDYNRAIITQIDLYNLQVSLQNSTLADTGKYKIIVEVLNSSHVRLTSTVSISITSAVPQITSSSSSMLLPISTQVLSLSKQFSPSPSLTSNTATSPSYYPSYSITTSLTSSTPNYLSSSQFATTATSTTQASKTEQNMKIVYLSVGIASLFMLLLIIIVFIVILVRYRWTNHISDKSKCHYENNSKFTSTNLTFSDKTSLGNKSLSTCTNDASVNQTIYEQNVLQTGNGYNLSQEYNSRQVTV